MENRNKAIDEAKRDVLLTGTRASTILRHLLSHGYIPACHVEHVRQICDAHEAAHAAWGAAIALPVAA